VKTISLFRRLIVSGALSFSCLAGFQIAAHAKTPPEVMALYKDFKAAEAAGNLDKAATKSYEAWQEAEDLLGDHKTTGNLANNYAYAALHMKGYKNYKKRDKAIKRSIELAKFNDEDADMRELVRRLFLVSHTISLGRFDNQKLEPVENGKVFRDYEKALDKFNFRGTTFEADIESLRARYFERLDKPDKAIAHAKRALELYKTRTDNLTSQYFYFVRIYKGDIHIARDEKIPAILEYQTVMRNLEGSLEADHPLIKSAFQRWLATRFEIEEAGLLSQAEAAGLCECWPFENYKDKAQPLKRVPPVMPRQARRSGHVVVKFDLDNTGETMNVEKLSSSDRIFDKAAVNSVKKWQYSKLAAGDNPENRTGIISRVNFRLFNNRGEIIPE